MVYLPKVIVRLKETHDLNFSTEMMPVRLLKSKKEGKTILLTQPTLR
jgi:hypothetical protein